MDVLDNEQPKSNVNDQPITKVIKINNRDGTKKYKIIELIIG